MSDFMNKYAFNHKHNVECTTYDLQYIFDLNRIEMKGMNRIN